MNQNQTTQNRGSQQDRTNPPADPRNHDNRQDEDDFDIPSDSESSPEAGNPQSTLRDAGQRDTSGQIPDPENFDDGEDIAEGDELEHGGSTGRGNRGRSSRLAETR